jgi:5'-3' exonuclease
MRLIKAPKKAALRPGSAFYTEADFEAEHGLGSPRLWADVMALQGDTADNIPGLPGVGAKTALRLVQAAGGGGVEGVLADGKWEGVKVRLWMDVVCCVVCLRGGCLCPANKPPCLCYAHNQTETK